MRVEATDLPGVLIVQPDRFGDSRGFLMETYHRARYAEHGIGADFVQTNASLSSRGVLRGLHFQSPRAQGKLVSVLQGEIFDVAVDIRLGSPTFGKWLGVLLSEGNRKQIYIPPGFAHGFCVIADRSLVAYGCTDYYVREAEWALSWSDPAIGIAWPFAEPILSDRDARAPTLSQFDQARLPKFHG